MSHNQVALKAEPLRSSPLSGFKLFFATIFVSFGTLLISLDQFIANVSIPTIAGDLGVSQDNGTWVITSYVVANAVMVPLTGWMTQLFGRVRLFAISAILFAITSLLCGLAISFPMLIVFRVLQGAVSGALIPLSQALLLMLFPTKRGFAMGMWGLVVMVGPALGPVAGGWITDNINWRWIFNVNVPLGILAGVFVYALLIPFESERKKLPIDVVGIGLLIIAVGTFQVMLDRGNDDDWFRSDFIRTLGIMALVSFCFFLVWETFHPYPVLDLSFLKKKSFVLGSLILGICMFLVFGNLVVEPIWVQAQLGYTPLWAGYSIALFGVAALLIFPFVGLYVHLLDVRLWSLIGLLIMVPPSFYLAYLPMEVPFANLAWPRLFQGIGFALFYVPLTTLSLSGISEKRMPSAAGLFSFVRLMAISVGVSTMTTYFIRRENFFQSRYVESVIPSNPQYEIFYKALGSNLGLHGDTANAFVYNVVKNQAYTETFLEINYLTAWGFILCILLLVFVGSPKTEDEPLTIEEA